MAAGTDSNYTNGAALTISAHDLGGPLRWYCLPRPLRNYTRLLAWVDPGFWRDAEAGAASRNVVVRVGQGMYTPDDGTRTDLVTDDRPYAGLLYAGVAWNRRLRPTDASYEVLDDRELTFGVNGPSALDQEALDRVPHNRGLSRY